MALGDEIPVSSALSSVGCGVAFPLVTFPLVAAGNAPPTPTLQPAACLAKGVLQSGMRLKRPGTCHLIIFAMVLFPCLLPAKQSQPYPAFWHAEFGSISLTLYCGCIPHRLST